MSKSILVADGNEANLEILSELFGEDYEVTEAADGRKALETIRSKRDALSAVVMDASLPELEGIAILEAVMKQPWGPDLPFILLSDDASLKNEKRIYNAGAAFFSRKPFDSSLLKKRVDEIADLYEVRRKVKAGGDQTADAQEAAKASEPLSEEERLTAEENKKRFDATIEFIGRIVESRDPENKGQIYRVKGLTRIIAKKLQELYPEYALSPKKVEMIETACAIHDIGNLAIPDAIVLKPGRLTDEEYEYMKSHTLRGVRVLDEVHGIWNDEFDKVAHEIIRSHHEKFDGGGYPDGLKGDDIPVSAQIVSLADTYDALVNDKVYRKAFSKADAYKMIIGGESGIFPPKILECFKVCHEEMEAWEDKAANNRSAASGG